MFSPILILKSFTGKVEIKPLSQYCRPRLDNFCFKLDSIQQLNLKLSPCVILFSFLYNHKIKNIGIMQEAFD